MLLGFFSRDYATYLTKSPMSYRNFNLLFIYFVFFAVARCIKIHMQFINFCAVEKTSAASE